MVRRGKAEDGELGVGRLVQTEAILRSAAEFLASEGEAKVALKRGTLCLQPGTFLSKDVESPRGLQRGGPAREYDAAARRKSSSQSMIQWRPLNVIGFLEDPQFGAAGAGISGGFLE